MKHGEPWTTPTGAVLKVPPYPRTLVELMRFVRWIVRESAAEHDRAEAAGMWVVPHPFHRPGWIDPIPREVDRMKDALRRPRRIQKPDIDTMVTILWPDY